MNKPLLEVSSLTKRFKDNTVLDGITFSIRKGEVVVLVGPSGCGKSTLLRCLNGIENIQEGTILLDGEPLRSGTKHTKELVRMRQKIGMVFQSYELFPHLDVLHNIMLAPMKVQKREKHDVETEARTLLERVGLSDKVKNFPRELSGGQKQRVAIVRALILHPEVILFDEVTAALDPEMVREVLDVILDLARQGRTMLIVTHEMAFARAIADRVLFLDGGHIVEDSRPDSFFDRPETERARKFLGTFSFENIQKGENLQKE
jgi:polar amino acid transport system ATP-binding protein